ncbi:hypothetical protein ACFPN0_31535 [Kitasatospora cinereorecta]
MPVRRGFSPGPGRGRLPGPPPGSSRPGGGQGDTWNSFTPFSDPDGNGRVVQEAPGELPAR